MPHDSFAEPTRLAHAARMTTRAAQSWDPEQYQRNAHFVTDLAGPVLDLLGARAGERILDLGCGEGSLAAQLVAIGCDVFAIDASAAQVQACRQRGIACAVGDGERLAFDSEFDAVFSNAALHWMRDADAVIAGVLRALRPGGRFVGEFGGHGCVAAIRAALHAELAARGHDPVALEPWFFPTAEAYAGRLQRAGFTVRHVELTPRPTSLPTGLRGWLDTFTEAFVGSLPAGERSGVLDAVETRLAPILRDGAGVWTADYTRLRFVAAKAA
jgi:SAM-dependent methyltransferase